MKKVFVSLLAAIVIAAAIGGWWLKSALTSLESPVPVSGSTSFEIPAGASANTVALELQRAGWIESARIWLGYARWHGLDTGLKAGEYVVEEGDTALELMQRFVDGDTVMHSLTLIEGWTFRQAIAHIQRQETVTTSLAANNSSAWLEALGTDYAHPEGLLFPSTYRFPLGTTDVEIARQAHDQLMTKLNAVWAARAPDSPIASPYEALILASIIEKETGRDDEREQISGVFVRRLKQKMRLQTDPTVIYGLGDSYDGDIRRRDLQTDTPYNTYTRAGLPPTPIALVGERSLEAATQPAGGTALFFVATGSGDGGHQFSDTLEEHEAAVKVYLRRLREGR